MPGFPLIFLTETMLKHPNTLLVDWSERLNVLCARGVPCFFLVDFEENFPRVWDLAELSDSALRFHFPGRPEERIRLRTPVPRIEPDHLATKKFREGFRHVRAGIQRGDSFLANLTFPTPITLKGSLEDVYWHSQAKYRVLLADRFVSFSPETFVTISAAGYLESRPMKGTAEDTPVGRERLLRSPKEIAEHATIVDLIRNDLSQVASGVRVTDYRYLRSVTTTGGGLVQTSSKVGGQLPPDWRSRLGTILATLLPAGSVSGAPKAATVRLIREAEGGDRGYYCGIAGYFDGQTVDTCVLIRFLERRDGRHFFRSGGGITALSDWREELAELRSKIRIPLR